VPTRLLDWSDGALVALYFALKASDVARCRGVHARSVVAEQTCVQGISPRRRLSARWDGAAGLGGSRGLPSKDEFDNDLLGPKLPLAIDPSHVARRFAAQRSRFTIFGRAADGLAKICDKAKGNDCRLCRIPIRERLSSICAVTSRCAEYPNQQYFPTLKGSVAS